MNCEPLSICEQRIKSCSEGLLCAGDVAKVEKLMDVVFVIPKENLTEMNEVQEKIVASFGTVIRRAFTQERPCVTRPLRCMN